MKKSKTPIIFAVFLVAWLLSAVAFIVLKCFGLISWSWWWLLVPIFYTPLLALLAVGTVGCCALLLSMSSKV